MQKSTAKTASLPMQKLATKTALLPIKKSAAKTESSILSIYIFFLLGVYTYILIKKNMCLWLYQPEIPSIDPF
jgi:hypothetical protein